MAVFQGLFQPPNIEQLRAKGDIPAIIKALSYKKDEFVRLDAVRALAALRDPQLFEPFVSALQDERWRVRIAAVEALGALGDPRAIDPLTVMLYHDEYARRSVVEAFGQIGDPRAIDPLLDALGDRTLLKDVSQALARIGSPAVDSLVELLSDRNPTAREIAIKTLIEIGDPSAVEAIIERLNDTRKSIQGLAATALEAIGEPAIEPLIQTLHDPDDDKRAGAAAVLRKIGGARVVDLMREHMFDPDTRVREACVWVIGDAKDERAIEPLIGCLVDYMEVVRYAASVALVKMGEPTIPALLDALQSDDHALRKAAATVLDRVGWTPGHDTAGAAYWIVREEWEWCREIGEPAVEPLLVALANDYDDPDVRVAIIETLGELGDPRAVEQLTDLLMDDFVNVCLAAAEALGSIGDPAAVPALIRALSDEYEAVCMAAAESLGAIGDERAVVPLISILADQELFWVADRALVNIGTPAIAPLLEVFTSHTNETLRHSAARTLGHLEADQAVGALIEALEDPSEMVRWASVSALGTIKHPSAAGPLVRMLVYQDVHWMTTKALRRIGAPTIEPLVGALKHELAPVRRSAALVLGSIADRWVVGRMLPSLKDPDERVREAVAKALGNIADERAAEPLAESLMDPAWRVRRAAAGALDDLGIYPDNSEMGALYWIAKREWPECVKIGGPALVPLIVTMQHGDDFAREGAAWALGKMRDPRVIEPLTKAMHDQNEEVRHTAATALGRIGSAEAVPYLNEALKDPQRIVRRSAIYAMINIGPAAIEPLSSVLEEKDEELRDAVITAIGKMGSRATPHILPYLQHRTSFVRAAAVEALGRIGDKRAASYLTDMLTDSSNEVRILAAHALGEIGNEEAIDSLVAAIKYADTDMQIVTATALEKLGWVPDRSSAGAAYWMAKGEWERCAKMGEAAVEPLIRALKHRNKNLRQVAAETLGKLYRSRKLDPIYKQRVLDALEDITDPFVDETLELLYEE